MAQNSPTPVRSGGIIARDLAVPFHSLHQDINRLFDDIFHGRLNGVARSGSLQTAPIMPSMDVSETDGEVKIRAELPGVSEGDIDVSLDGDVLIIRGEKKLEKTDDEENFHLVERAYGVLQRALQLPCPVDADKVRADFGNGVLTVTLPKCAELETSRKIPVERAGAKSAAPTPEPPPAAQSKVQSQVQRPADSKKM